MNAALVLLVSFTFQVNGLCDFPCTWQDRIWKLASNTSIEMTLPSSSQADFTAGGSIFRSVECFSRQGPFYMNRVIGTDIYHCINVIHSDKNLITLKHIQNVEASPTGAPPDFCSFCSQIDDASPADIWVAEEHTEIDCNIPKNCPSGTDDTPCTGCEDGIPDDGYCCDSNDNKGYYKNIKNNGKSFSFP